MPPPGGAWPTPQYGPPPPEPRSWKRIALAIAVIVVAGIVVLAVLASSTSHPTSPSVIYGDPFPYSDFTGPVATAVAGAPDGPWTPFLAEGWGIQTSLQGRSAAFGTGSCASVWTASGTFVLPATPASASIGEVSTWVLVSINHSGAFLVSIGNDLQGVVSAAAVFIEPAGCLSGPYGTEITTSAVVDSPTVASRADADGGSAYLEEYPHPPTQEYLLFNDTWAVVYSTCAFASTSGTGQTYLAEMWATNGTMMPEFPEAGLADCD